MAGVARLQRQLSFGELKVLSNEQATSSHRSEFILGLVILAIGVFLFWSAEDIPISGQDDFGARSLPRAISAMIAILGVIWSGIYFVKWQRSAKPVVTVVRSRFLLTRIIPLMMSSFIYAYLFQWFGYLVSTFLTLIPVLYLYGNKSIPKLLLISAVTTVLYYLVFIKALGVFDAGGSVINFNQLLGL